jgi:hypothetical protein
MTAIKTAPTKPRGLVGQFTEFFRTHWSRGKPGRETPEWVLLLAFRMWLVALLCKMLGSSWDMSWHFKWQRDDLAPPHLINTIGTVIVVVLVMIHTFTGMACDRRSLRLMQWGTAVFLVAGPLDVINHRINGLDLTAWSPSHFLLFMGTALMILGAIDAWIKLAPIGRTRSLVLGGLWLFFLENTLFPNGQQEYGILSLQAWLRGEPDAEPSLLRFAAETLYGDPTRAVDRGAVEHFALPIPDWVYPLWGIGVAGLVLIIAARTIGKAWAATLVATAYVAYRALIWPALVLGDFPPSTVPFYLVFVGLAVDLARRAKYQVITAAAVTAGGYGALLVQDVLVEAPPTAYWTAPITFAGLTAILLSRPAFARLTAGRRTPV